MTILKQHTGLAVIEGELWIERQAGRHIEEKSLWNIHLAIGWQVSQYLGKFHNLETISNGKVTSFSMWHLLNVESLTDFVFF